MKTLPFTLYFIIASTFLSISSTHATIHNVMDYGAKPDGRSDSTASFMSAWNETCSSPEPATLQVPNATFLLSHINFTGPCTSNQTTFRNNGTLLADPTLEDHWIKFERIAGLTISGGAFNGQGEHIWRCKANANDPTNCPMGGYMMTVTHSSDVALESMTLINSTMFHTLINDCTNVTVHDLTISASNISRNTDGIHTISSSELSIENSTISTYDDCISLGPGSVNFKIRNISCGPGHGISIGSLGNNAKEEGVQNITISEISFNGTDNGLRIKTRPNNNTGFVDGISYENISMTNVKNPIIIDQYYCGRRPSFCHYYGESGIKLSNIRYRNISGTSATDVAVNFNCSGANPCTNITLENVTLMHSGKIKDRNNPNVLLRHNRTLSYCRHARIRSRGVVDPRTCP